ncbi:unnamed protein product [Adineta steineri]|uniref:G-protein coupled receptors family 1 profile domain-containing protein n=1 Tax=Adineta steineri TaxID=433720 RepID=A0A813SFC0_9BILA|nr:unnamed protein product [Adineta steineri]CAF0794341.1 unnamed protein product [Adineta steineri]
MNSTISLQPAPYNFVQAAKQPIMYTYLITTIFIVIMNILNVWVLNRPVLRSSSCTYYLLASVMPVPIFIIVTPVNQILVNNRGLYISGTTVTCKLVMFFISTSSLWYASMLVCATIDRFLTSSTLVHLRHFTQVRVARIIIPINWILILIYMSPFIIIYYYDPMSSNANKCVQYSTTLISIYLISRVIVYYVMVPLLLAIFGTLTIYNIRTQRHRIAPVNQFNGQRRTESQLARMLIIQVASYLLFFTPSGIIYILVTFFPSLNTSYYATIRSLAGAWQQGGYFISFFFYIFSGKIYREELKKIFRWDRIRGKIFNIHNHPHSMTVGANMLPSVRE